MKQNNKKEEHQLKIACQFLENISEIDSLKSRVSELELFVILFLAGDKNYLTLDTLDKKATQLVKK